MIPISASNEIETLKESPQNYQFDKKVFFALITPLLFVVSFLTLHLIEIFCAQRLLAIIAISLYTLLLYPIYRICKFKINRQNNNLMWLRKMITVDYKTCKFCGKQLTIKEFYNINKHADLEKIILIWNSNLYGLLCCNCFEKTPSKFWIKFKEIKKIKN